MRLDDSSPPTTTSNGQPKKLRRITRACDYCHKRSIRCKFPGHDDHTRCQNCIDFDQPCRFDRVIRRRGAKPRCQMNGTTASSDDTLVIKTEDQYDDVCATPTTYIPTTREWKAPNIASQDIVADLVEIFFEIVYPNFPFFHRPTFLRRIASREYLQSRFTFGATMAICALVSARITDRAVYNPHWDLQRLTQIKSEVFYAAAVKECGNVGVLLKANFDLLRACALLAVTAIQYGKFREMQTHLGKYHTLVAMDGLHDEENWPQDIGIVETEERRRLFWSIYNLDIYTSIVWCGMIRCREQQCNVSYTTEIDDELFDDDGYRFEAESDSPVIIGPSPSHSAGSVRSSSWLCGWNFTTDLYRIMEHVITDFRDKRRHKRSFLNDIFGENSATPASSICDSIMAMYNNLPHCFKETHAITCDPSRDRYGFQAANITATVQLVRMVLFSSGGATIEERCKIASEVVDAFMRIPVQYLQAISSPLLYHLAGIGSILGSVFEEPLSESGYLQVRVVLLALAQLLENLDNGIHSTASAEKLRTLVAQLNEQMKNQRRGVDGLPQKRESPQGSVSSTFVIKRSSSSSSPRSGGNGQGILSHSNVNNNYTNVPSGGSTLQLRPLPSAMPSDLLEDWPWSVDFMALPEG